MNKVKKSEKCLTNTSKKLCSDETCNNCYERSFASSEKSILWSPKNKKSPRETFKFSNDMCLLDCNVCFHEYEAWIHYASKGGECSYCRNRKLCPDKNNCKTCIAKSFATSEKAAFWSPKIKKHQEKCLNTQISNIFLIVKNAITNLNALPTTLRVSTKTGVHIVLFQPENSAKIKIAIFASISRLQYIHMQNDGLKRTRNHLAIILSSRIKNFGFVVKSAKKILKCVLETLIWVSDVRNVKIRLKQSSKNG